MKVSQKALIAKEIAEETKRKFARIAIMKVVELRVELERHGKSTKGLKPILRQRLERFHRCKALAAKEIAEEKNDNTERKFASAHANGEVIELLDDDDEEKEKAAQEEVAAAAAAAVAKKTKLKEQQQQQQEEEARVKAEAIKQQQEKEATARRQLKMKQQQEKTKNKEKKTRKIMARARKIKRDHEAQKAKDGAKMADENKENKKPTLADARATGKVLALLDGTTPARANETVIELEDGLVGYRATGKVITRLDGTTTDRANETVLELEDGLVGYRATGKVITRLDGTTTARANETLLELEDGLDGYQQMTESTVTMTLEDLRAHLAKHGQDTEGSRDMLRQRLVQFYYQKPRCVHSSGTAIVDESAKDKDGNEDDDNKENTKQQFDDAFAKQIAEEKKDDEKRKFENAAWKKYAGYTKKELTVLLHKNDM